MATVLISPCVLFVYVYHPGRSATFTLFRALAANADSGAQMWRSSFDMPVLKA